MLGRPPPEVDVDHIVPLAEAWGSGAHGWTQDRRLAFANDLGVGYALNVMTDNLNSSKGDRGPEEWLPPVNQCRYVEIWTLVKHRWSLTVDATEQSALVQHADGCPNNPLSVPRG